MVVLLLVLAVAPAMVLAANGTAKFSVVQKMFVAGHEINAGVYEVKWESSSPEATVTFINSKGEVSLKVQAKVEEIEKNFESNSLLIGKDSGGRDAIKGLQFAGEKTRILFE
jgi:hypothetical protein